MFYESTRGKHSSISSAEAIKLGIAPDGGLFVPSEPVTVSEELINRMTGLTYNQRAEEVLRLYLTDFTPQELKDCVYNAYNEEKFDHGLITPLHKLSDKVFILELWHGPTCAFKDIALQILPHLLTRSAQKTGETDDIVILVATSGDTGKAALEGFKNVPQTKIVVFYPNEGVSQVQKQQMVTQEGNNVSVVAVQGNFDDAQTGVKNIFGNAAAIDKFKRQHYKFSSANSINWGRLVPQVVYYFSAYADLLKMEEINSGEAINFVVPTGNFGNILAAFYARCMGLPINRLICAANENNVLTDFINSGIYDRERLFKKTLSPSMDILISSNLERLLYELTGHDSTKINEWMRELKERGKYKVAPDTYSKIKEIFWSDYASDQETLSTIKEIWKNYKYVMDTHTAVAQNVYAKYIAATGDKHKTVIASTASPFKFNESVVKALLGEAAIQGKNEFELLNVLADTGSLAIPKGLQNLDSKPVLHKQVVAKEEMLAAVENIILS
ncbi:threonine synthase [Desulfofarcimen acetoxidans DSM 771]|jgi:threonine synthase|uniref:Threonine synthase n=1 Tax=Desulfofarcimen acetoxidans (strain ATCC 49208 / DSM 771 / KCTC 5769 / VKM B-1644 / 5575) TaxID=485916 RepID=C8W380_DESAS|nr:threonine synthase [Desulfofarcimen acetoxidans]ACV61847.1 threonine synthase [Desulfofarcimen acetoxidans DSM 771]